MTCATQATIRGPPSRSRTAGDARQPAAAVEIEECGACLRCDPGGGEQEVGVGAVDLDRGGPIVVAEAGLAARQLRVREDLLGAHELGDAQHGAEPAARPAERRVGHVLHRREHDGVAGEQRGDRHVAATIAWSAGHAGPDSGRRRSAHDLYEWRIAWASYV
jgi:hypothetical protein